MHDYEWEWQFLLPDDEAFLLPLETTYEYPEVGDLVSGGMDSEPRRIIYWSDLVKFTLPSRFVFLPPITLFWKGHQIPKSDVERIIFTPKESLTFELPTVTEDVQRERDINGRKIEDHDWRIKGKGRLFSLSVGQCTILREPCSHMFQERVGGRGYQTQCTSCIQFLVVSTFMVLCLFRYHTETGMLQNVYHDLPHN